MHIEIDDWFGACVVIAIGLVLLFFVVYGAVRLALSDMGGRPVFSCETSTTGELNHFVLTNVGSVAAFDVAVRSVRDAYGQPFVRTALLAPQAACTWESPGGPSVATTMVTPMPLGTVDWLSVEWRPAPDGPGRWTRVPVRLAGGAAPG